MNITNTEQREVEAKQNILLLLLYEILELAKQICVKMKVLVTQLCLTLCDPMSVMSETQVQSLSQEDPLEKGMTTHSSILAWRIPWTEEPGKLQSMGLQGVRHDLVTYSSSHRTNTIQVLLESVLPGLQS